MARGDTSAQTAETSANNLSNTYGANASSLYGSLAPQLETEAAHPAGFSPSTLSAMNTAGQQSAGGSMAGAVGQGGLLAARTRNAGAPAAAIDSAARSSSAALSKSALGTQTADANLKAKEQQSGLGGLEGLYGENLSGSTGALGQVAANSNANTNAENASWDWSKDLLAPILSAAGSAASPKGCWIAEAVYGIDDPRTHIVRAWLNGPFRSSIVGDLVMGLYLAIGQTVAKYVKRSRMLRAAFKPLFDMALNKALGDSKEC